MESTQGPVQGLTAATGREGGALPGITLEDERRVHAKALARDARVSLAEWVEELTDWYWFVTMTGTPPGLNEGTYTRRGRGWAWKAWLRAAKRAEELVGQPLGYVAVMELHKSGVPHVHALVGRARGTLLVPIASRQVLGQTLCRWLMEEVGFCVVRNFGTGMGGSSYICKYITKDEVDWKIEGVG